MKDKKDELKLMDMKQVGFYLDNGVQPIRIEKGYKDKIVFIYSKKATTKLFGEWLKKCKEYKNNQNKK